MAYIGNPPQTAAFLVDTFSGTGSQTAFTMTVAPANTSSILVSITGVVQDPSTYSVSSTTLTFSTAPPSGTSNISVRYLGIPASGVTTTAYRTVTEFTATSGQTSFSVPSYTVGYIDVYRNGVRLVSTDYTATTGTTVVLGNACTVNDAVVTESFLVSSVLNAIPATAGSVSTSYLVDGSVTQAKLSTNVAGNGPAFSASASAGQSLTSSVLTKISFNTEQFDTNSNYDSATNYRFTPTVAGYYQISAAVQYSGTSTTTGFVQTQLYKNGTAYSGGILITAIQYAIPAYSVLVSMNGSSDYVEIYAQQSQGTTQTVTGQFFTGFMVRSA